MGSTAAEQATGRDYCRGCERPSVQRFSGYATTDGHENGRRPRAFYRQCVTCGTQRLVLGNVDDAEGLCRVVLRDWLRGKDTSARVAPTGQPTSDGHLDASEALGWLQERIWDLYTQWDPPRSPSFLAFADGLLRKGIGRWAIEASGEPTKRPGGRTIPKAHAASVSTSYDAMVDGVGEDPWFEGRADSRPSDAELEALKRAPLQTRQLVLMLYIGYSKTEAAARLGVAPSTAGQMLHRLRAAIAAET